MTCCDGPQVRVSELFVHGVDQLSGAPPESFSLMLPCSQIVIGRVAKNMLEKSPFRGLRESIYIFRKKKWKDGSCVNCDKCPEGMSLEFIRAEVWRKFCFIQRIIISNNFVRSGSDLFTSSPHLLKYVCMEGHCILCC